MDIENTTIKKDLIKYVTEQHLTDKSKLIIRDFCYIQKPSNITVYRAHNKSQTIRPSLWFSTSKNKELVKKEFAGPTCCVFTIHLINVPIIDINSYIEEDIKTYSDEAEIIVLGGGKFFKDKKLKNEGFLDIGDGNFETWYTIKHTIEDDTIEDDNIEEFKSFNNKNNIEKALEIIPEDEYELIDNIDDIVIPDLYLSIKDKEKILEIIKSKIGGKIKKRRFTKRKFNKKRKFTKRKFNFLSNFLF